MEKLSREKDIASLLLPVCGIGYLLLARGYRYRRSDFAILEVEWDGSNAKELVLAESVYTITTRLPLGYPRVTSDTAEAPCMGWDMPKNGKLLTSVTLQATFV